MGKDLKIIRIWKRTWVPVYAIDRDVTWLFI